MIVSHFAALNEAGLLVGVGATYAEACAVASEIGAHRGEATSSGSMVRCTPTIAALFAEWRKNLDAPQGFWLDSVTMPNGVVVICSPDEYAEHHGAAPTV